MSKTWTRNEIEVVDTHTAVLAWRRMPQYIVCAAMGLIGGSIGVALAIGLAIAVQLSLPPERLVPIGVVPLMVIASSAGLGVSWLLGRVAHGYVPSLMHNLHERGLQVIMVFSAFASLLQTLLFFLRV